MLSYCERTKASISISFIRNIKRANKNEDNVTRTIKIMFVRKYFIVCFEERCLVFEESEVE